MIQANELRIGNWISYKGNTYQVKPQEFSMSYLEHSDPILLTPEILKQAGFEAVKHVDDYVFYTGNRRSSLRIISIYTERTTVYGYSVPHCKYLHQLQNLVLTNLGTELNVQL
jgi:hypothetical protein